MATLKVEVLAHKQATDAAGKEYTAYDLKVTTGDGTTDLTKRYSEFEAFHKATKKDLAGVSFPGKSLFGSVNLDLRTTDLNKFMEEVCSRPMPADSQAALKAFVSGGAVGTSSPAKAPVAPQLFGNAAPAPAPAEPSNWDPSFMSGDPLASMSAPAPAPAASAPAPSPVFTPAPAPAPPPAFKPMGGGAPSFFAGSSSKTYPLTGEGLRDAIKDSSVDGVKKVLVSDPNLCHYKDRIGQSMLHLAAMFNNAEICTMLVEKGANLEEKNNQGETVLDVASVSLAMKLKAMKVS